MRLCRYAPLEHPLAHQFQRAIESLTAALAPDSARQYRGAARHFLIFLGEDYPAVCSLNQLLRDPHILGWFANLRSHTPPLAQAVYVCRLLFLRSILDDLQREFHLARSQPRHRAPQPKAPIISPRAGLEGVVDSLLFAQHAIEMFRRSLPDGQPRHCLDRISNRLTKILSETHKLNPAG